MGLNICPFYTSAYTPIDLSVLISDLIYFFIKTTVKVTYMVSQINFIFADVVKNSVWKSPATSSLT